MELCLECIPLYYYSILIVITYLIISIIFCIIFLLDLLHYYCVFLFLKITLLGARNLLFFILYRNTDHLLHEEVENKTADTKFLIKVEYVSK